ncbi:MAG: hypothetical protein ABI054_04080 [Planctomycetota bacterium]
MKRIDFVLSALLLPGFLISPRNEERLVFEPREGSSLEKQAEFEIEGRLTRFKLDEYELGPLSVPTVKLLTSAKFTDKFERVGNGRPLEYVRRFGEISGKWESEGRREDIPGFFALSASSVRFEWDSKRKEYTIRREEGACSLIPLDKLIEDMDLRGLLPDKAVANGTEWTVQGRSLTDALFGGTEMGLIGVTRDQLLETMVRDVLLRPFRELAERQTQLRCKYIESFEPEETRFATVSLRHADRYWLDLTEPVNQCLNVQGYGWNTTRWKVRDFFLRWKVDCEGNMIWNVTEGHFESLEFEAKVELEITFAFLGRDPPMKIEIDAEGTGRWHMKAEAKH